MNKRILTVAKAIKDTGHEIAGMIAPKDSIQDYLPVKPCASDDEFQRLKLENPDIIKGWKKATTEIHNEFNSKVGKLLLIEEQLRLADEFKDYENIWFPHNCDYRGRIYPIPNGLNPQMNDLGKGLLEFSNGVAIEDYESASWLAIHGANEFGEADKENFEGRLDWISENEKNILSCAEDPLANLWWTEADNPWQFLAFCLEWSMFCDQGLGFVSHIPVAVDGTCNGLQHLSAMLMDERGAKAVNLLPSDKPSDIYQEVADVCNQFIEKDVDDGGELGYLASQWFGYVDRSWTKRNTMTVPYGVTQVGMKDQVKDELRKLQLKGKTDIPQIPYDKSFETFNYLANRNGDSIDEVVPTARPIMNWFKDVAKIVSEHNKPLVWYNYMGFPVLQQHKKMKLKQIKTMNGGIRIDLSLGTPTQDMNKSKQVSCIAPNYVHSQDASHLVGTCLKLMEAQISDFTFVHDSYAVHASHVTTLNKSIRRAFIEMYESKDMLESFRGSMIALCGSESIPELPPMGDFDINLVEQADYFFS